MRSQGIYYMTRIWVKSFQIFAIDICLSGVGQERVTDRSITGGGSFVVASDSFVVTVASDSLALQLVVADWICDCLPLEFTLLRMKAWDLVDLWMWCSLSKWYHIIWVDPVYLKYLAGHLMHLTLFLSGSSISKYFQTTDDPSFATGRDHDFSLVSEAIASS